MSHRPERLAEAIREELIDIISGEMGDPRVGLVMVTEVKLAPEMRVASVFVTVAGDSEEQARSLRTLIAARGYMRSELACRLHIRQIPDLRFELDQSAEFTARLDQLLSRAQKHDLAANRRRDRSVTNNIPEAMRTEDSPEKGKI